MNTVIMEARELEKVYRTHAGIGRKRVVRAVDRVNLSINRGEILALVGESACGKTTLGLLMARVIEAGGGKLLFEGRDVTHVRWGTFKDYRRRVQIIFQDPYTALNPRMTVGRALAEPLKVWGKSGEKVKEGALRLLDEVQLNASYATKYPHELSGGEKQRIAIARSLSIDPDFLVADESVSAVDLSTQAKIVNLLLKLKQKRNLTLVFITHDLGLAASIADRVAIMYLGGIVEIGKTKTVFNTPHHPYTVALLSSRPIVLCKEPTRRIILQGDVPTLSKIPEKCRFYSRCFMKEAVCEGPELALGSVNSNGHAVACHLSDKLTGTGAALAGMESVTIPKGDL
jgi:oligopeptide/dipeptide ABC transporter ATP-binding protein